ncbi:MAG: D-aminoacyl-tRNA deacylase [Acidimicrobiia bacterium]
MRLVVQRVSSASVTVGASRVASIGLGLLVLVGIAPTDEPADVAVAAGKLPVLRLFPDDSGAMNRSLVEVGGSILAVSQFTLLADVTKGRRPSFTAAAPPETAAPLFEELVERIAAGGVTVESGVFGALMEVELVNDGPVTLILEISRGRIL